MNGVLGLAHKSIQLVPYDARWPVLFEREAVLISRHLGPHFREVVHIGSTAVPNLDAKPVIDLMGGVADLRTPWSLFVQLADLGYEHRPRDTVPGRLFFAKDSHGLRTHNLSVCKWGSGFWVSHLKFRDRLRSDENIAHAYAKLKLQLAENFPNDRVAYTDGKDQFIAAVIGE
jgi:GrpB-like predicted nucleotidyltransferase (UPF0157 family)